MSRYQGDPAVTSAGRSSTRRTREVLAPATVREVAAAIYGRPDTIELSTVVDLCIVGAGPAGLAAAVYGASEGL